VHRQVFRFGGRKYILRVSETQNVCFYYVLIKICLGITKFVGTLWRVLPPNASTCLRAGAFPHVHHPSQLLFQRRHRIALFDAIYLQRGQQAKAEHGHRARGKSIGCASGRAEHRNGPGGEEDAVEHPQCSSQQRMLDRHYVAQVYFATYLKVYQSERSFSGHHTTTTGHNG